MYSLEEWVETLPERKRRVINDRLSGKRLRAIAKEEGCSPENIRLLCNRVFGGRPFLEEDKLLPLFCRYSWKQDSFCAVTGREPRVFVFLDSVAGCGKEPLVSLLSDSSVPECFKDNYRKFLDADRPLVGGVRVNPKSIFQIANAAVKEIALEPVRIDEFIVRLRKYISDNKLNVSGFKGSTIGAHFLGMSKNIICSGKKKLRYYPVMSVDIKKLSRELGLASFHDVEISAKLLFDNNREVMARYDIRDWNELHNLLRVRSSDIGIKDIKFTRMPYIVFGKASREEQILGVMREYGASCFNDIAKIYCDKYGFTTDSFNASFNKIFGKYRNRDGVYIVP